MTRTQWLLMALSCMDSQWDCTSCFSAPRIASELRVTWAQNLRWPTVSLDGVARHSQRRLLADDCNPAAPL